MRRTFVVVAIVIASLVAVLGQSVVRSSPRDDAERVIVTDPLPPRRGFTYLSRLPPAFVENRGQFDEKVRFALRTSGQTVWVTPDGIVFELFRKTPHGGERLVFAQDLLGSSHRSTVEGRRRQPGLYNYFLGPDQARWRTGVPAYNEIIFRDAWDAVDIRVFGRGRDLEQEFVVRPGGRLTSIQLGYRGIDTLAIARDGTLLIHTAFGLLRESKPRVYQEIGGKRREVEGRFKLTSATTYTFEVGAHDPHHPVVIDPTLVYSTYLGGGGADVAGNDEGIGIAVHHSGEAYVTGFTRSLSFPATPGVFGTTFAGGERDVFVTRLTSDGTGLIFATYLGGAEIDWGAGIAVDRTGNAYVTGFTSSLDFPVTRGAYQTIFAGAFDAFVTKLSPTGARLLFSTYLGGSGMDWGAAIDVHRTGDAYVTGFTASHDFAVTPEAVQRSIGGDRDAFVTRLDPSGSTLVFSTYLGGQDADQASGISVDRNGRAHVTGLTASSDFPTTPHAHQTARAGEHDAFVSKLNVLGTGLLFSTYLGGSQEDAGRAIAVHAKGAVHVTGTTQSADFPVASPLQLFGGVEDAFVTKLNAAGMVVRSTYLGGQLIDQGFAIAVDAAGHAVVTGLTNSEDFPLVRPLQAGFGGGGADAFVTRLGATLDYSTYLGGHELDVGAAVAVDGAGNAYVTGFTSSTEFPLVFPAQPDYAGTFSDAFVAKLSRKGATSSSRGSGRPPLRRP